MSALKDFLQGKWLRHSLHSVVVTIPLGLWTMSLALDAAAWFRGGSIAATQAAFWAITVGIAGVLIAVPTGIADWLSIKPGRPARRIGIIHALGNVLATILQIVNCYLRHALPPDSLKVPPHLLILSAVAVLVVLASGYLGGRMVYEYGIGVARFQKKELRAAAVSAKSNVPPEKS